MSEPTKKPENPPAFPGLIGTSGYGCAKLVRGPGGEVTFEEYATGMTLRDWFAGQVLPGCYAAAVRAIELGSTDSIDKLMAAATQESYAIADGMLLARERNKY